MARFFSTVAAMQVTQHSSWRRTEGALAPRNLGVQQREQKDR